MDVIDGRLYANDRCLQAVDEWLPCGLAGRRYMMGRRWCWTPPVLIFVGVIEPSQNFVHADPVELTVINYAAAVAPLLCRTLDEDPTVAGVAGLMQVVVTKSGLTPYQDGEIVALSVISECPWHTALLNRIAANYGSPEVKSA